VATNPSAEGAPPAVAAKSSVADEGRRAKAAPDAFFPRNIVFYAMTHLLPLGALWSGVTWQSIVAFAVLYWGRIFFITAGYHCYFSHRAFETSRAFQLALAIGAQSSGQGSVLRWAAAHRHHHQHSDQPRDVHSPARHGLYHAHFGWLCRRRYLAITETPPAEFARFPELALLDRYQYVPYVVLAAAMFAWLGWPGLLFSYGLSTLLTFHATFTVNSLAHRFGYRTYDTPDDSRNNWFVAFIMLGGGWHNNHHRYPRSARMGFRWWELDATYHGLKVLESAGVVRGVKQPPRPIRTAAAQNPR
jgi:stearoyl-CoA desaturase (Delta-9 desaturase)